MAGKQSQVVLSKGLEVTSQKLRQKSQHLGGDDKKFTFSPVLFIHIHLPASVILTSDQTGWLSIAGENHSTGQVEVTSNS